MEINIESIRSFIIYIYIKDNLIVYILGTILVI